MEAEAIAAACSLADAVRNGTSRDSTLERLAALGVTSAIASALAALVEAWLLPDDVPVERVRARLRAAYDDYFARTRELLAHETRYTAALFAQMLERVDEDTAAWVEARERRSVRIAQVDAGSSRLNEDTAARQARARQRGTARTGLLFEDATRREWRVYSELDALVARLAPAPDVPAPSVPARDDDDDDDFFEFDDSDEDEAAAAVSAEKRRRRRAPPVLVPIAPEALAAIERAVAEEAVLAPVFARWFEPSVPIEFARLGRALAVDSADATAAHEQGEAYDGPPGFVLGNVERLVAALLARSSRRDKRALLSALELVSSALPTAVRGTAFSRPLGPTLEDRLVAEFAAEAGVADDVELLVGYVLASNTLGGEPRGVATAARDQMILRRAVTSNRLELAALALLRSFAADVLVPVHAARTLLLPSAQPLPAGLHELLVTTGSNRFEAELADRRERERAPAGTRYRQLRARPVVLFWEVPPVAGDVAANGALAVRLAASSIILEAVNALGGSGLVVGARGVGFEEELVFEERELGM